MKIETKIVKGFKGHHVTFTIGNQTFKLQECENDGGMTSYQYAKWYKNNLDNAFKNLLEK